MLQEVCPYEYHQFVDAFISFNDVVTSSYGRNLLPQYKTSLSNFKGAYLKLNISVTSKVHAVFYHIEEFCSLKNMGLAPWNELLNHSIKSSKSVGKTTWFEIQNILYTAKDYYKQYRCSTALIFSLCLYDCIC